MRHPRDYLLQLTMSLQSDCVYTDPRLHALPADALAKAVSVGTVTAREHEEGALAGEQTKLNPVVQRLRSEDVVEWPVGLGMNT
jgi:hypothetical protein